MLRDHSIGKSIWKKSWPRFVYFNPRALEFEPCNGKNAKFSLLAALQWKCSASCLESVVFCLAIKKRTSQSVISAKSRYNVVSNTQQSALITKPTVYHRAGTFGCMVEYGADHQLSQHSRISAHVSVGVPLGVSLKLKWAFLNCFYFFRLNYVLLGPIDVKNEQAFLVRDNRIFLRAFNAGVSNL